MLFKVEDRPFLWAIITTVGLELSKLIIKNDYFNYFKTETFEFILFFLLELIVFIGLAYSYKFYKKRFTRKVTR